jgi:hypothetical protein
MNREIEVKYSKQIIKFAVWKYWIRSIGIGGFISFAFLVVGFLYVLISGDRSWFLGVLGAVVGLSVLFAIVLYFVTLKRSMEKFLQMDKPTAIFHFTDERIRIVSDIGSSELSWKMIEKIWTYPSVWLIFISQQGYFTLPTASLDEDLKSFILDKVGVNVPLS